MIENSLGLALAIIIVGAGVWFLFVRGGRGQRIADKTREAFREDGAKLRDKLGRK